MHFIFYLDIIFVSLDTIGSYQMFVSETHLKPEQKFEVHPFITINNPYTGQTKKPCGGVSCLIRSSCMQFVSTVDKPQNDMIHLGLRSYYKVLSNYIPPPPADSIYYKDEMFTSVAN